MAMDIKFLRGVISGYNALASKDPDTLYFCTDGALYLGNNLIAEKTDLTSINAAIQAIQNAGYQNASQVGTAITNALVNYYDKNAIDQMVNDLDVGAIEGRVDDLETWKTALATETSKSSAAQSNVVVTVKTKDGKVSGVEVDQTFLNQALANKVETGTYAADKITQSQKDAAQDQALTDYKAEMVETLKGYQTTIPAETYDAYGSADKALSDAKVYVDGKFTDANLDQYTTEQEVKDIVDEVISAAADVETTITGLTELVDYIEKHGGDASAMAQSIGVLEGKVDVIEKKPAYAITSTQVSNWDGEVGAKTLAQGVKDVVDANKSTWDKASTALQADDLSAFEASFEKEYNDVLNSGVTPAKFDQLYNGTKATVDANKSTWDLAATAVQPGDLAPYAKTNDISADIAKGVAAKAVTDTLKSAAFAETTAFDAAGTAAGLVGVSASVENGPTGVYAAIQGATTNTVKDCVDGINAVTTQLTWGSF